ncbi:MAG: integrase arm-type DNA-binding domain-containing protein [Betaproteobacteria bacterium]|nr:integrase arm-type DNA-binding domain-containing protein [Betaproteobacteria bacterium]MDE2621914.1 integrase arm-type DNA-binding domain-containing protein [Betaproteobacteria bacterium]
MPKIAKELGPLAVSRITEPGYHPVGGVPGLLLRVSDTGSRNWILRATVGSKRRDIGLGGYPAVTLADARNKARDARDMIKAGLDPVAEAESARSKLLAEQAKQVTFADAVIHFLNAKSEEWSNRKHGDQWRNTLREYAEPILGQMLVSDIDVVHIERVLAPIWKTKTETASRLRGRIEAVLAWATVRKYRQGANPAVWRGNLDHLLAKPSKIAKVQHHPALPYQELGDFMVSLRQKGGISARALEFAILTTARSGEVRGATWAEFDLAAGIWTIPAERMKAKKEHRVPLSRSALDLLRALPSSDSPYVFPAPKGGMLSDMALSAVTKRMGLEAVPHGFRSTFRDWCAEQTNYPREVAEMALAHTIGNAVEAAYRRGDLFEKRRNLMQEWDNYCNPQASEKNNKVTAIRRIHG